MKTKLLTIILSLFFAISIFAQETDDKTIFEKYKSEINTKLPLSELIIQTGRFFLDKPYVGSTLEINDNEQLVVNLREMDCTTFVETTLALSLTARSNEFTYENFCKQLTRIRYRNGEINQYPSRLHYFSDWILNNEQKDIVTDITPKISCDTLKFKVGFMSSHPDKYKALREHPEFAPTIASQEDHINQHTFHYIPKAIVADKAHKIKSGDIIAITTSLKGLDISHVGFALWDKGNLYFLHASSSGKKVMISDKPLSEYLNGIKSHTGILVIRAQ